MIVGRNLIKKFDGNVVFDNFSFSIESGEYVCFSGESGSGKTTLLNMIGMIEPYDGGIIEIDGCRYLKNSEKLSFFRNKVGFLFQNFALLENKTVKENLEMIRPAYRRNISVEDALSMVNLQDKTNNKVYTLSGGEQQRVALARLYLKRCDIVLVDEPTGSLNHKNANIVISILKDMHGMGKTIVLVSHDKTIKRTVERIIEI